MEYQGRVTREDERMSFEHVQADGAQIVSQLLTASDGAGTGANAARLAHAESVVADHAVRLDSAYANAPSATQEPYVGAEPDLERLVVAHAGDVCAAVRSDEFVFVVQQTLEMNPHELFIDDEDGQRFETWEPSESDSAYVASVVGVVRKDAGVAAAAGPQPDLPVASAGDAQAMSSLEHVLKNRSPRGPKAGLGASGPTSGRDFQQSERLSRTKRQDNGLEPPPF